MMHIGASGLVALLQLTLVRRRITHNRGEMTAGHRAPGYTVLEGCTRPPHTISH